MDHSLNTFYSVSAAPQKGVSCWNNGHTFAVERYPPNNLATKDKKMYLWVSRVVRLGHCELSPTYILNMSYVAHAEKVCAMATFLLL